MKHRKKIVGCVILGWLLCQQTVLGKVFDEALAVRYQDYAASHTIEDATLYIGTYLIHVQGLTDELYEKALESASDSNQMNVYYKSELASGSWIDITDAGGLSDIAGQGPAVEESELADLWVTCYTGSDGITRDARDDHTINIFNEPSPYDLYHLEELEPIKIQYSNVFSSDSTGVDRYYYKKLRDFFSLNLQNEITQECDLQLLSLQGCYESLRSSGKEELSEIVSRLMSKIDSRRRAEIFNRLSQMDGNELSILQDICSGSQFEEDEDDEDYDDYDNKQFVENAGVIDAIGLSIQNCQESYIEHTGNMLEEGDTVLKNAEYARSTAIVERAAGGFGSEMEALLLELKHLYHLEDNIVADADAELRLLDEELISQADLKYGQKLTEGVSEAYQTAAANGSSEAVKNQALEDQKAKTDAARLELQYLLQAKIKRQPAQAAAEFCYQRIEHASALSGQIAQDAYHSKAAESIDAHILWLKELAGSIEEDADLTSELQNLGEKKTQLLEEQTAALDRNDLSTVRKYETLLAQVDKEIETAERGLNAVLSSTSSSAADKARAANQAGRNSVLNLINETKDAALLEIAEGNTGNQDSIMNKLDALASLGAESAIQEIREKMSASGNDFKEALAKADQALEESRESSLYGQYEGAADAAGNAGTAGDTAEHEGTTGSADAAGSGNENHAGESNENAPDGSNENHTGEAADDGGGGTGEGTGTADAFGGGTGADADGTGRSGMASAGESDLLALIEEVMGAPFDDLNDNQKAAVVAALDQIGESGNQTAADMAKSCLNQCVREGNRYVYLKLKGNEREYLPLQLIASCEGYRYVYSDSKMEVTLSKKLLVYRFKVYRDEVQLLDHTAEKLESSVKIQGDSPYLLETDAEHYFTCEAEYIDNTEYGVCLGTNASGWVREFLDTIQEGAE